MRLISFFFKAFCLVFLGACSLEPMMETHFDTSSKVLKLNISKNGYSTFKLQKMLEQKKGLIEKHLKSNSTLSIIINESYGAIGVTSVGTTSRGHGSIIIDLVLKQDGHPDKTGRLDCVSSYNINFGDNFIEDQTKESVQVRLLNNLSDQIIRKTLCLLD